MIFVETDGHQMSEEENIQSQKSEDKSECNEQSQPEPQTTTMETHAHHLHKAPSSGWKHYFFEFFMLFLAVFCGFLAENQREHFVEHQREKKLMESLYEDLKKDTADFINDTTWWSGTIKRIDTIRMEIEKPGSERNLLLLYRKAGRMRSDNSFQYHDRTIQQLKNGGNFRLVRNKAVADSLIDYDVYIITALKEIEAQSKAIYLQVNFMQDKIFNSKYFHLASSTQPDFLLDSVFKIEPAVFDLSMVQKTDLMQYYNHLEFYRRISSFRLTAMKLFYQRAIMLIELLEKEYHLK
jgi:hypothetical protein